MGRVIRVWTWDVGERDLDVDVNPRRATSVLQTILEGGLWAELRKFPTDAVERLLPSLHIPPHTRRLLELWIEETRQAEAR